ncbi:MAG: hypothetical protein HKN07_09745, partial [Acidimicrobiia bacterium]|nr:hypothetical protein [Acidimicrobiia bacterium]
MTSRRPRRERPKVSSDAAKVLRPTLELPAWSVASEEQAQEIHDVSLRLLEEAGIAFYDDESVEILRSNGVEVDDEQIARFDRETIEHFLKMPPPTFEHTARNPEKSVILGDNHIVFAPVAGPPFAHDMERGRREGTLADLENFIKMSNATPYLHQQGTEIVVPGDVPFHERALDINYAHI